MKKRWGRIHPIERIAIPNPSTLITPPHRNNTLPPLSFKNKPDSTFSNEGLRQNKMLPTDNVSRPHYQDIYPLYKYLYLLYRPRASILLLTIPSILVNHHAKQSGTKELIHMQLKEKWSLKSYFPQILLYMISILII